MRKSAHNPESDAGQMLFTYRRSFSERLVSGEMRDVSGSSNCAGFRWPLAVTRRLWDDVEAVPSAYRRNETPKSRWQHLFLLAAPAAAQMQREGKQTGEINVVLRTTGAPDRSREHIKTLVLRLEHRDDEPAQAVFTLGYKGE
jgi:hypothetical protein